ncbi:5'-nucleotidase [Paraburkholderia fungorum]|uniref:5'-nucleotidase n=1 Tax=Paraburkholderia fungorum TaxID=134537 RepID=UPI0038BC1B01
MRSKRLGSNFQPVRGQHFSLVRKLTALKRAGNDGVDIAILSRNGPVTGLRVFSSARHHQLPIGRAIFTSGAPPYRYLGPLGAKLFLSANAMDVEAAMAAGFAAARVYPAWSATMRRRNDDVCVSTSTAIQSCSVMRRSASSD